MGTACAVSISAMLCFAFSLMVWSSKFEWHSSKGFHVFV
jgi:hypothetical protein